MTRAISAGHRRKRISTADSPLNPIAPRTIGATTTAPTASINATMAMIV